jgi:Putative auto-transporter adhesin, head GIN domain
MKYILQFLLLFSSFASLAQKQFVVDADAELRTITGSFTSVKVSNAIHLYLSKGEEEAIAISATSQKYKDGIKTEIVNGQLIINYDGPKIWSLRNHKLNVYVSYKNLQQIAASSASFVMFTGLTDLPLLSIIISGASNIAGTINIVDLNIKCSGASDVNIKGAAKNVNVECSGASDLNAFDLTAENCTVKASGASDVNITATKEITINASGASNVFYKGTAEVKEKNSSGASTIAKQD